jgi:hypothetical protein
MDINTTHWQPCFTHSATEGRQKLIGTEKFATYKANTFVTHRETKLRGVLFSGVELFCIGTKSTVLIMMDVLISGGPH